MKDRNEGDLQVWWIPQIPGKAFKVDVTSVEEGVKIMDVLADYDSFQYKNNIKPDYSNAGGLAMWSLDHDGDGTPGWEDWYIDDGRHFFDDPRDFINYKNEEQS